MPPRYSVSVSDSPEQPPAHLTSIFEAARLGWNVQLTCVRCGSRRVLHAAALWLNLSLKGKPDDLNDAKRVLICGYCRTQGQRVAQPRLKLVRDPPTGEPMTLPTERQWKEGLRWQRR